MREALKSPHPVVFETRHFSSFSRGSESLVSIPDLLNLTPDDPESASEACSYWDLART